MPQTTRTPTIPDTTTSPDTERRLSPDRLCEPQKERVVRRIIRELP